MSTQALHPVFAGILTGIVDQRQTLYIAALRGHDWAFEFSDDGTVYRAGLESLRRLQALRAEIDADGVIWNREAPEGFKVGGVVA